MDKTFKVTYYPVRRPNEARTTEITGSSKGEVLNQLSVDTRFKGMTVKLTLVKPSSK